MTVATILNELNGRGISVVVEGNNLRLRGAPGSWDDLRDRLRAAKAELIAVLKTPPGWGAQDWRDCYEERAAILEYDERLDRAEAERQALLHVVALWQDKNPPKPANDIYGFAQCGSEVRCDHASSRSFGVPMPLLGFPHGAWVHDRCVGGFRAYQRAAAIDALRLCHIANDPAQPTVR